MDTILGTSFARAGGRRGGRPNEPEDPPIRPRAGPAQGRACAMLWRGMARDPEEALRKPLPAL